MDINRPIAEDRLETEPCEKGTVGCAILHELEDDEGSCESW